jgi:hypothetical protein
VPPFAGMIFHRPLVVTCVAAGMAVRSPCSLLSARLEVLLLVVAFRSRIVRGPGRAKIVGGCRMRILRINPGGSSSALVKLICLLVGLAVDGLAIIDDPTKATIKDLTVTDAKDLTVTDAKDLTVIDATDLAVTDAIVEIASFILVVIDAVTISICGAVVTFASSLTRATVEVGITILGSSQ